MLFGPYKLKIFYLKLSQYLLKIYTFIEKKKQNSVQVEKIKVNLFNKLFYYDILIQSPSNVANTICDEAHVSLPIN